MEPEPAREWEPEVEWEPQLEEPAPDTVWAALATGRSRGRSRSPRCKSILYGGLLCGRGCNDASWRFLVGFGTGRGRVTGSRRRSTPQISWTNSQVRLAKVGRAGLPAPITGGCEEPFLPRWPRRRQRPACLAEGRTVITICYMAKSRPSTAITAVDCHTWRFPVLDRAV